MKLLANRVEVVGQPQTKLLHVWDENIAKDPTRTALASVEQIQEETIFFGCICSTMVPSLVFFARQEHVFICGKNIVAGCN
jgi:hypothetical protein